MFTLNYTNVSIATQITLKFLLYINVTYLYSNHFTSPEKYLYFNTNAQQGSVLISYALSVFAYSLFIGMFLCCLCMYPVHKKSMSKTANRNYLLVDAGINYQIRCLQIPGRI